IDYDFYQPSFDGDSIWNFFASQPTHTISARGDFELTDRLSIGATGLVRAFTQATQSTMTPCTSPTDKNCSPDGSGVVIPPGLREEYPTSGAVFVGGGGLAARYRMSNASLGLRGNGQFGDGNRRVGADIFGEKIFDSRYVLTARTGVWEWR